MLIGLDCETERPADILELLSAIGLVAGGLHCYVADQSLWGLEAPLPDWTPLARFDSIQPWCIERLVLHLYPEGVAPREVDTYAQYCAAPCELIVLAYDSCHLELYCKNPHWLGEIFQMVREIPGIKVREKHADSDTRYRMYV